MGASAVGDMLRSAAANAAVLCLAGGLPAPESLPRHHLRETSQRALSSLGPDPLQYDWPEGRPLLRALIAARMRSRGAEVSADDIVVTSGAQDALALALEISAPKHVLADARTYPAALELFRAPRAVPTRSNTLRYAMPALMNPDARALNAKERADVLAADVVIEDDAYADLRFRNDSPRSMCADHRDKVFYIGSFSKTISPGLRVGWLVPPKRALSAVRAAKGRRDLQAGGVGQALVEHLLSATDFERRLQKLRDLYRLRWARFGEALRRVPGIRFREPEGGFSVWVETDLALDDEAFLRHAIRCGVSVDPGSRFLARATGPQPLCVRLSFSAIDPRHMKEAVARFAGALATAARAGRRSA